MVLASNQKNAIIKLTLTTYGWTQSLAMQRPQAGAFDRKSGRFRLFCFDPAECRKCGASPHGSFFHGGHKPCGNVEP
jgi:hypothetical protein